MMVVLINDKLNMNTTVDHLYETQKLLGCINKEIVCRSREVIATPYSAVVRPELVFVLGATFYKEC